MSLEKKSIPVVEGEEGSREVTHDVLDTRRQRVCRLRGTPHLVVGFVTGSLDEGCQGLDLSVLRTPHPTEAVTSGGLPGEWLCNKDGDRRSQEYTPRLHPETR